MTLLDRVFFVLMISISLYGHYMLYVDGRKAWKKTEGTQKTPERLPTAVSLRENGDRKFAPYYCGTVFVTFVDVSQKENKK